MHEAVIVDAVRTPAGKRNGMLSDWHPADLAGHVLKALEELLDLKVVLADSRQESGHLFEQGGCSHALALDDGFVDR